MHSWGSAARKSKSSTFRGTGEAHLSGNAISRSVSSFQYRLKSFALSWEIFTPSTWIWARHMICVQCARTFKWARDRLNCKFKWDSSRQSLKNNKKNTEMFWKTNTSINININLTRGLLFSELFAQYGRGIWIRRSFSWVSATLPSSRSSQPGTFSYNGFLSKFSPVFSLTFRTQSLPLLSR